MKVATKNEHAMIKLCLSQAIQSVNEAKRHIVELAQRKHDVDVDTLHNAIQNLEWILNKFTR